MITSRWFPDPGTLPNIKLFRVYRSIVGFCGKLGPSVAGKTLELKVNNETVQTITFGIDPVADLNLVEGGAAYTNFAGDGFLFRSDIRDTPGYVEIVGGTVLSPDVLEIGVGRLIEAQSEDKLIAEVLEDGRPATEAYEYKDNDGSLLDYYAVSAVDDNDDESSKTPYMQPLSSSKPLCVVEGTLCNIEGARICDALVKYKIAEYSIAVDKKSSLGIGELEVRTSHNGRFCFAVVQGIDIHLSIPAIGFSEVVCIPEVDFCFLNELIKTDQADFKSMVLC